MQAFSNLFEIVTRMSIKTLRYTVGLISINKDSVTTRSLSFVTVKSTRHSTVGIDGK